MSDEDKAAERLQEHRNLTSQPMEDRDGYESAAMYSREASIRQEVYRIADRYLEALYEALDKMDKRHDATATEIIQALRYGGYDDEADGYEQWLEEGLANEQRPRP